MSLIMNKLLILSKLIRSKREIARRANNKMTKKLLGHFIANRIKKSVGLNKCPLGVQEEVDAAEALYYCIKQQSIA